MKRINLILIVSILFLIVVGSLSVVFVFNKSDKNLNEGGNNSSDENTQKIKEVEPSFREKTLAYDTSQKILDLLNSFKLIERDNNLFSANEVYEAQEGTEYDLLRLATNILLNHNIQAVIVVYQYGEEVNAVVNFRDVDEPKYYYFEEGVMKMKHHGWSFNELMESEESRLGINIDKYGTLFENNVRGNQNINLLEIDGDWVDYE